MNAFQPTVNLWAFTKNVAKQQRPLFRFGEVKVTVGLAELIMHQYRENRKGPNVADKGLLKRKDKKILGLRIVKK